MGILTSYFTALLTTGIVHLSLAIFVLARGITKKTNQTYALYSASIAVWAIFEAFGITASNDGISLLLWRINHMGVIFIPVGFVHFVYYVTDVKGWKWKLIPVLYGFGFVAAGLNLTDLLILEVVPKFSFNYFINPGKVYHAFFSIWLAWIIFGLFELFSAYFKASGNRRNQLKYFCWSMLIAYIGGVPNFFPTFGIVIPVLMPFGTYAIPIYAFFTVYAIIRHRLMNINIYMTRAFIFAIVYALVLGVPFGLAGIAQGPLTSLLGDRWFWAPMALLLGLATIAPFLYLYLQGRTERLLLKDQHRYQNALRELCKTMTRIRNTDELIELVGTTLADTVKTSHVAIYLMDDEYKAYKRKFGYSQNSHTHFEEFLALDHQLVKIFNAHTKPVLAEEIGGNIDEIGIGFSLAMPCFIEGNLLAFIMLGAKPGRQMYTQDDLIVFETLSYSTALAVENCFFWREIEDRQRRARLQEMDTFSYSLAHEIDNPMSIIIGNSDLLKMLLQGSGMDESRIRDMTRYLDYIQESSQRVSAMVKAIYDFGQKSSGDYYYLEINDVVESFVQLYMPEFKQKKIRVNKEIPEEPVIIYGEKRELMNVFINFAKNSIHALRESDEKKIAIKVEKVNSGLVRITFSDTGHGIPEDKVPIVFAPFVTTKASSEGSGMGLYLVKRTIDRHKGKVRVGSHGSGKGTSIILELPIAETVKEEDLREQETNKGKRRF